MNPIYKGISRAAWGCFFLYFDVNIGSVSILPRFGAFLLYLSAISLLQSEEREFSLLRPLAMVLAVWNGLHWLTLGFDWEIPTVSLLISVVELYFNFQFFTDLAHLAEHQQNPREARRMLHCRTVQLLSGTLMALPIWDWFRDFPYTEVIYTLLALLGLITGLILMVSLFFLRKSFPKAC